MRKILLLEDTLTFTGGSSNYFYDENENYQEIASEVFKVTGCLQPLSTYNQVTKHYPSGSRSENQFIFVTQGRELNTVEDHGPHAAHRTTILGHEYLVHSLGDWSSFSSRASHYVYTLQRRSHNSGIEDT